MIWDVEIHGGATPYDPDDPAQIGIPTAICNDDGTLTHTFTTSYHRVHLDAEGDGPVHMLELLGLNDETGHWNGAYRTVRTLVTSHCLKLEEAGDLVLNGYEHRPDGTPVQTTWICRDAEAWSEEVLRKQATNDAYTHIACSLVTMDKAGRSDEFIAGLRAAWLLAVQENGRSYTEADVPF